MNANAMSTSNSEANNTQLTFRGINQLTFSNHRVVPTDVAMVVVPDPNIKSVQHSGKFARLPAKYYVIEIAQDVVSREQFLDRRGAKLINEGDRVIVYSVEPDGQTPTKIVPRTAVSEPQRHGEARWLDETSYGAGQTSQDGSLPFTLSVNDKTPIGFTISVDVKNAVKVKGFE